MLKRARDWLRRYPHVHHAIRSVWVPPRRVYQHLYFDGVFTVEVERGASIKLESHGEFVENELFWRGYGNSWEAKSLRLWAELARTADFIADIGANTGVYALSAKAVRQSASVIALEPSKAAFARLKKNIALNGVAITPFELAASDKNGEVTFYDVPSKGSYLGSLEATRDAVPMEIAARRMDDVLSEAGFERIDLVKVDVERHEPAVLRGMRNALERWRPSILIEILDRDVEVAIRAALAGIDYGIYAVGDREHPGKCADSRNYLICRDEVAAALPAALSVRQVD